jgi:nifR3 family TIM-barrel protein
MIFVAIRHWSLVIESSFWFRHSDLPAPDLKMQIGTIHLPSPVCQAGLAGYSDRAMRVVARRRGCPYAVTEALLDTILLNGGEGLRRSIDIDDEDHPVAGQIIGAEPEQMASAARILAERGYDVIDLNFACPVKKIKNKARGGHMLFDAPRGLAILKAVRDVLPPDVPTTVSLRRGFDDSPESHDRFDEIVEAAWENGYSAVRVHGRTVEQKYQGRASWDAIREVKRRYPDRTILGSGDVFAAEDAVRMLRETGVDIVWIARGAIGNPWIFWHVGMLLGAREGEAPAEPSARGSDLARAEPRPPRPPIARIDPPTIHEQCDALAEHFAIAMQIHGEQLAGRRMRKTGIKYSRFHPLAAQVKSEFINVRSLRDWTSVLEKFYTHDGAGVWPDPSAADEVNAGADLQSCEIA